MTLSIKCPIFELSFIAVACNKGKFTYLKKFNKTISILGKPQDLSYLLVCLCVDYGTLTVWQVIFELSFMYPAIIVEHFTYLLRDKYLISIFWRVLCLNCNFTLTTVLPIFELSFVSISITLEEFSYFEFKEIQYTKRKS